MTSVEMADKSGCTLKLLEVDGRLYPSFNVENLKNYRNLKLREDDVILCAYPKSGTHWVWEITKMLVAGKVETVPFKKSMQMLEFNSAANMAEYPSPRIFNTHALYEALPHDAFKLKTKLIWVARNPKDVAVSLYNHHIKLEKFYHYSGTFSDWLDLFLEGRVDFGCWYDYMKDWEKAINGDVVNPIHVIMYEDMKEDPVRETTKLAKFLDLNLDPALIQQICDKCAFDKMAEDKKPFQDHAHIMFRKGQVGDWKNTLTVAQSETMDALYEKHMKDCTLKFRYTL